MRITFDLMNCGLGNNGGSQTIVKSANTLVDLGCDVTIIDSGKNQYTWDVLKANHKIIKYEYEIPNSHFIIGTGYNSWKHMRDLPERCGKKVIYLRGWETWNAPEDKLVKILSDENINIIVNSIGLLKKLDTYNIDSIIVRPGHDFKDFEPLNIRQTNRIILGGLYNQGSKRSGKRTDWIFKAYKQIKSKYAATELHMFGVDGVPNQKIDYYIKNPSKKEKNRLFNNVNIWLAPTENEGLHVVPQEAMLTKCFVVGTNAPMSGMHDYLVDEETGFVSENNLKSFIATIERATHSFHKTNINENAKLRIVRLGNREDSMERLMFQLEHYMV